MEKRGGFPTTADSMMFDKDLIEIMDMLGRCALYGKYDGGLEGLLSRITDEVLLPKFDHCLKERIRDLIESYGAVSGFREDDLVKTIQACLPRARVSKYQVNQRVCPHCGAPEKGTDGKRNYVVIRSSWQNSKGDEKVRHYKCSACGDSWESLEVFFT